MNDRNTHLRFAANAASDRPGLAFAPLVDIVLLLICFYLFVSKSIEAYEDPTIELPTVTHVQSLEERPAEFVINLRPDGTIHLNDQPIEIDTLAERLQARRQRMTTTGRPMIVVIRADRRERFGALDRILTICRGAGIRHLSIRAVEPGS